jgi:hypothetical protein
MLNGVCSQQVLFHISKVFPVTASIEIRKCISKVHYYFEFKSFKTHFKSTNV